jgi:hypothetical protein
MPGPGARRARPLILIKDGHRCGRWMDAEVREQAMAKTLQLATLPSGPVPTGCYLVHNDLGPVASLSRNGFRAWIQTRSDNLVECDCNFGGCENSKLHKHHYRLAMK